MINWITQTDDLWCGTFISNHFRTESSKNEIEICIDNSSVADYAEKCVLSFNHLPESVILDICHGIIKCIKKAKGNTPLKILRYRRNPLQVLEHCRFSSVYINPPEDENLISYIVEGEGDWNDIIGFVVHENRLAYVGTDYFNDKIWRP